MTKPFGDGTRKLALIALLLSGAAANEALADTLVIQGSTTFTRRLMEPQKAAIEADAKHEMTVIPNKSLPGLIALMEGRAHMAMISSSLKTEVDALQKVMPGLAYDRLQAHEILNTRIAIGLHPSNRVRKASLEQIKKVLLAEIKNWSALGGADLPIRVVLVGGGGGVTTVIESELLGGKRAEGPHVIYVKTPVQLVQVTGQEPAAMGFAQLALVQQRGLPELLTEQPIDQTLSLVTLGDPTPAMNDIIRATRRAAERVM
jgi:ABC-type phosphate transport system substrate-binding protein